MELTESFWNTPKVFFGSWEDGTDIMVFRRCLKCGRFLTKGQVLSNALGHIKTTGWTCHTHGEVEPFWEWCEPS